MCGTAGGSQSATPDLKNNFGITTTINLLSILCRGSSTFTHVCIWVPLILCWFLSAGPRRVWQMMCDAWLEQKAYCWSRELFEKWKLRKTCASTCKEPNKRRFLARNNRANVALLVFSNDSAQLADVLMTAPRYVFLSALLMCILRAIRCISYVMYVCWNVATCLQYQSRLLQTWHST